MIEEKAALEEIILFSVESRDIFKNQKNNKIIIDNDGCRVI